MRSGGRALLDEPGEAARQRAGLPGARAGHDQQRPTGVGDDRALIRVQAVEEVWHADLGYAAAMPLPDARLAGRCAAAPRTRRATPWRPTTSTAERSVAAPARARAATRRSPSTRRPRTPCSPSSRRSACRSSRSRRSAARWRSAAGRPQRWVVVDPVDGSVNAKRGLPFACVSIAVASGPRMGDVEVGFVAELGARARLVGGARRGRLLRRRAAARARAGPARDARRWRPRAPERVAAAAEALGSLGARRLRALGSVAASMCLVAARPARRDGDPARGPLGRRGGGPADRDARPAGRWRCPAATRSTSRCARACWPRAIGELLERLRTTFAALASGIESRAPMGDLSSKPTLARNGPRRCVRPRAAPRLTAPHSGHGSSHGSSRRVDCSGPGIRRRRRGKGFEYLDADGARIDRAERDRAHPRARDPARLGGRLDLPLSDGPHPGHRHRRRGAQAVPLPRPLARAPRRGEVRRR